MAKPQNQLAERTKTEIAKPRNYVVIVHDDDITSMEFVVYVLQAIFDMSQEQSETLMMRIHDEGAGIAGSFSYEIAEQKIYEGEALARANNFPLKITMEVDA